MIYLCLVKLYHKHGDKLCLLCPQSYMFTLDAVLIPILRIYQSILRQSSFPNSNSPIPGNLPINSTPLSSSDLDVPIAIRKGVRNCTKHSIANYLSYHKLSEKYKTFTTNVSHLFVPRNIQEALGQSEWKSTVYEEMRALQKNKT